MSNYLENKPNLYIVRVADTKGNVMIKFGYSGNIEKRLQNYMYHNPLVEVVGTYYKEDAYEFEKKLHSCLPSTTLNEWYSEIQLPIILDSILTGKLPTSTVKYAQPTIELYSKANILILDKLPSKFYTAYLRLIHIAIPYKLEIPYLSDSTSVRNISELLHIDKNDVGIFKELATKEDLIKTVGKCWAINPYIVKSDCKKEVIEAFATSIYRFL